MEKTIFMGKRKSLIEKVMGKLPDLVGWLVGWLVGLLGRGTCDSGSVNQELPPVCLLILGNKRLEGSVNFVSVMIPSCLICSQE